ncbi:MAG TPA: DUF697 domain-containing protein [Vicinamibacterales bacterium]|nr:DUF697 domain-containing protein [Vicinamibacterales bacterium]
MTEKELGANRLVNKFVLYSGAAGLVPIPLFDIAAITGVQLKMLSDLAKHYQLPFSADRGKSILTALLGGLVSTKLGFGEVGSLLKGVPVVGSILGMFTTTIFASAATYAVGKVFIQHFESGGTFLDFDPDKVRKHFADEYEKAKTSPAAAA